MGRPFPAPVTQGSNPPLEWLGTDFAQMDHPMQPEISRMEPRTSVVDIPRKPRNTRKRNLIIGVSVAAALAAITFGLSRLRAAAPVVDRSGLWTDTVKRGRCCAGAKARGLRVPSRTL